MVARFFVLYLTFQSVKAGRDCRINNLKITPLVDIPQPLSQLR